MNKTWCLAILFVLSFAAFVDAQKPSIVGAMQGVKQSAGAETTTDVTMYQIKVFVPIVVSVFLLYAIFTMLYLDTTKDSLLYAKFLTNYNK